MKLRRRWALSLVDAALSRVDQIVLPRLSRAFSRWRARAARGRLRLTSVLAVLVLLGAAALAVAVLLAPRPAPPGAGEQAWVGVHEGDPIADYIELSRSRLAALAAAEPERASYALVSFADYLSPDAVAAVLATVPGVTSVTGYARVPLAGERAERVSLAAAELPGDLVAAMAEVAVRKEGDADEYAALAQGQPEGTLRQIYAANAETSRTEALAYRSGCACVFALVARGRAAALAELATAALVRVVDPAPELTDPAGAVFAPPLPEQVERSR